MNRIIEQTDALVVKGNTAADICQQDLYDYGLTG